MAYVFSIPVDRLIQDAIEAAPDPHQELVIADADVVIVGSGYGACVAAMKLAGLTNAVGDPISVMVLERGREYAVGDFPNTLGEMPGHVRFRRPSDTHPTGNPDALFDLRAGEDLDILTGNGLGGGSLINANVAARPVPEVLDGSWPARYQGGGLDAAFAEIEKLLGAVPATPQRTKGTAFHKLADSLGFTPGNANITVTQGTPGSISINFIGVDQPDCTGCGNCVTGCNIGSKNTLMMNLIPLGHERGAEFVTGANVLSVAAHTQGDRRWRLKVQRTRSIKTTLEDERFFVDARYVILAAGALGSTEILLRSDDPANHRFSDNLGKSFSSNGDGLGFTFGQIAPVEALGTLDLTTIPGPGPGPTITRIAQHRIDSDGTGHPITLEDGAVPAAIIKLFGEMSTTAAMLNQLGNDKVPGWFAAQPHEYDPAAYNPEILKHCQVLLAMSDDHAKRELSLQPDLAVDHRTVFPSRLDKGFKDTANAGLRLLDDRLRKKSTKPGLDSGLYLTNPLWRLLDEQAGAILSGNLNSSRNLSVHPLGGCAMGADIGSGVVNEDGAVFDAAGGLHDGLFVMDGAIIPRALATNPFLTISAVTWECCESLIRGPLAADGWSDAGTRPDVVSAQPSGLIKALHPLQPQHAKLVLQEQMIGRLLLADSGEAELKKQQIEAIIPGGRRFFERDGMILHFKLRPFDVHGDFASLANAPITVDADVKLYVNPQSAELSRRRDRYGAPTALADELPVATGTAKIRLLHLDREDKHTRSRTREAIRTYFKRREGFWQTVLGSISSNSDMGAWEAFEAFWFTGRMHADYRYFRYEVDLDTAGGSHIHFAARKNIRWQRGRLQLWDALLNLPVETVELTGPSVEPLHAPAHFKVDAGYMLDEGLIQVNDSDDMVQSAMSVISFLAWFARCVLRSSFWEFGAPEYPETPTGHGPNDPDSPRPSSTVNDLQISGQGSVSPVRYPFLVPGPNSSLELELHRYQQPGVAEPVLLIHGLAQGSAIYNTPDMSNNMAGYFWKAGYDVWLLDYRLSNRFGSDKIKYNGWTIDEIGAHDMPEAVRIVYDETSQKIKVFAHCVGATGIQMAILSGQLKDGFGANRVESVCFNAIHPWIVPAAANLARSKLGTFARDWISDELLNPIPQYEDRVSTTQSLLDRLGFSVARLGQFTSRGDERHERGDAMYRAICDRMTFLYSRMWRHENLEESLHQGWLDLVGRAPDEVYEHLYYIIERERILDHAGENVYLEESNLTTHWAEIPTLFLHGDLSDVFNPQSATRSAVRLDKILRFHESTLNAAAPPGTQTHLAPVYLLRIPEYGHMDPILARTAHVHSFPMIKHFFAIAAQWHVTGSKVEAFDSYALEDDPDWPARTEPYTGQILRAAWIDNGQIARRYWIERYPFNTSAHADTIVLGSGTANVFEIDSSENHYQWIDYRTNPLNRGEPSIIATVGDSEVTMFPMNTVPGVALPSAGDLLSVIETLRTSAPVSGAPSMSTPKTVKPGLKYSTTAPRARVVRSAHAFRYDVGRAFNLTFSPSSLAPWYQRLVNRLLGVAGAQDTFHFLVGSCRYPGLPMERHQADKIFGAMRSRLNAVDLDVAFFIGDQIYADAYNDVFDAELSEDRFRERYRDGYRSAFNSPNMREFLASLPIHFAIDDHEIADNWSGTLNSDHHVPAAQVTYASKAARLYMSSGREVEAVGIAPKPAADTLWYALDHINEVNFPCFVLDTRSERDPRRVSDHAKPATYPGILDHGGQLQAFKQWLTQAHTDQPDRPKFVFAGQILAPLTNALHEHPTTFRSDDGFFGYPGTLRAIIDHMVSLHIRNVVFIGGDLHLSSVCQLRLSNAIGAVQAWQIVASGLYSPMPFANARISEYQWSGGYASSPWQVIDTMPRGGGTTLSYRGQWLSNARSQFLQVTVDKAASGSSAGWDLAISVWNHEGIRIPPGGHFDLFEDDLRLHVV